MTYYTFIRADNGNFVNVDFATMMTKVGGVITLPDGVTAHEVPRPMKVRQPTKHGNTDLERPIVSDALGFISDQFIEFEADRQLNGFSGIEFKPDPQEPGFYQVHCHSASQWGKYIRHRGMADRNSRNGGSGGGLSRKQLEHAIEREKTRAKAVNSATEKILNADPVA